MPTYGETSNYGDDPVYGGVNIPTHASGCVCDQGWRIEATHLATGVVKAVLHPITMDWEEPYSRPGDGTLMVATRDPSAADIWPHETGIYISRVFPNGVREGRFGGYIEKFSGSGGGATTIGLKTIDDFLNHRLLADDNGGLTYSTPGYVSPDSPGPGLEQTKIAAELVRIATSTGIPLIPVANASTILRVRHWDASEFKNIGEAIQELTGVINGVTYRLVHSFFENPARWETRIVFSDEDSIDNNVILRSDSGSGYQYGLEVDAKDQAGRVYGVGIGEGASEMFSIAYDADGSLPEFQKTVAWKDISVPATLDDQTRGEVVKNRDPVSTPVMTLAGLTNPTPQEMATGDIVSVELGYGLATYRGEKARVLNQAYRVATDEPTTRTIDLLPVIRPSLSVKTQVPAVAPPPETPNQGDNPPPETPIEPPPAPTPTPSLPAQVLDLTNWKWTGPTGSPGKPIEVKQPQLATYTSEFLHTSDDGPSVAFKAPQDGVTTANTQNTRSELREMTNGGATLAAWSSGTMEATLAFIHLPASKPHVVGMQIHDASDDISVLRLENTDLWITDGNNTHYKKIMSGYQLGTFITVKVTVEGGTIRWFLNGTEVASLSKSVKGAYFKAGCYQQAGHTGSDYGEVHIKALTVSH